MLDTGIHIGYIFIKTQAVAVVNKDIATLYTHQISYHYNHCF